MLTTPSPVTSAEQPLVQPNPAMSSRNDDMARMVRPPGRTLTAPSMQPTLQVDNEADVLVQVTQNMCPAFDGIVVHRVYSTC